MNTVQCCLCFEDIPVEKLAFTIYGHKEDVCLACRENEVAIIKLVMVQYHNLLYQVENKYEGESRYDTALRYIKERVAQNHKPDNQGSVADLDEGAVNF